MRALARAVLRSPPRRTLPPAFARAFRATQALVVVVVLARIAVDILPGVSHSYKADLAPIILFMGPVIYAACIFGATVSPASAVWVLFLAAMDMLLLQRGLDRWSSALEVSIIGSLAVYAGRRLEHEMAAHRLATEAEEARQLSETAYRTLFAHSQTAILIAGDDGIVRDANVAALALFAPRELNGQSLSELFGADVGRQLLAAPPDTITLRDASDAERVLCPIRTAVTIADRRRLVQFVLRDVTEERKGQLRKDRFTSYVLRGEEEQRRQLARELHDEPIQALISVCHRLDVVPHRAALPADTLAALEESRARVEQTVLGLRDLARGLRPSTLDDLGLVASLRHLIDELEERSGIETQFHYQGGERRLTSEAETGLFRITQEALRNVERHAAAQHVLVELTLGREACLLVRDDGQGFSVGTVLKSGTHAGLGLVGVRERAERLHGRLEIHSSPGSGTTVVVRVPVGEAPNVGAGPLPPQGASRQGASESRLAQRSPSAWQQIDGMD